MSTRNILATGLALLLGGAAYARGGALLPQGFEIDDVVTGLAQPVDMAFASDGRIFVAEKSGVVRVIENGAIRPDPFIDLQDEVNSRADRGMLGLTLDPDFANNFKVYLLYVVDPLFGPPDESQEAATFGRLTCYTGTLESNGNIADPDSRCILVGAKEADGFPVCWASHAVGTVKFGIDGSLLVSAGDGAQLAFADPGGMTPECFGPKGFPKDEDVGAFRAQYLGSLAGKVLRLDPASGQGLPSNPHWTGDGTDKQSKVWVNGLRNPFQFTTRPGSADPGSGGPGTLYVGDVGWTAWEEINVAYGGENFGWPCRVAFVENRDYPDEMPAHSDCDSIETKSNPGPLTDPIIAVSHTVPGASVPPGRTGRCIIGGTFYEGTSYPEPYQAAYFYMDHIFGWLLAAEVDAQDALVAVHDFGAGLDRPTDIEPSPLTGDLHVLTFFEGRIQRIQYTGVCLGDIDGDGAISFGDLLEILANWGACEGCPEDLDRDGTVGFGDILVVLAGWGDCAFVSGRARSDDTGRPRAASCGLLGIVESSLIKRVCRAGDAASCSSTLSVWTLYCDGRILRPARGKFGHGLVLVFACPSGMQGCAIDRRHPCRLVWGGWGRCAIDIERGIHAASVLWLPGAAADRLG